MTKNDLHFHCIHCRIDFFCNVGHVEFVMRGHELRPQFENPVVCTKCHATCANLDTFSENFSLTFFGQSWLTDLHLRQDPMVKVNFQNPIEADEDSEINDWDDGGEIFDRIAADAIAERKSWSKVGRNEICPCGSQKKFKKCCLTMIN